MSSSDYTKPQWESEQGMPGTNQTLREQIDVIIIDELREYYPGPQLAERILPLINQLLEGARAEATKRCSDDLSSLRIYKASSALQELRDRWESS